MPYITKLIFWLVVLSANLIGGLSLDLVCLFINMCNKGLNRTFWVIAHSDNSTKIWLHDILTQYIYLFENSFTHTMQLIINQTLFNINNLYGLGAPWNQFKPSSGIFYWPLQGGASFVDLLCVFFSVLRFLCVCARLIICALCHLLGKGWPLDSRLWFNCEFVTFPLSSLVRCGTWLYRFLIFAPLLTLVVITLKIILLLVFSDKSLKLRVWTERSEWYLCSFKL